MALLTVGPNSEFASIADAMAHANPNDTVQLEAGYSNETATVTRHGMTITGEASSTGIVLRLATGVSTVELGGTAPINLFDAADGNGIVGNAGDNRIQVSAGVDSVNGGEGHDLLLVDYRLATGAVTGDSASNFTEAGGGGRMVTVEGGFEDFTIWTGSGADTVTTGDGDDVIRTGEGAGTVNAGQGANVIVGGGGADTITGLDGGNLVQGGDGENTITTGGGADRIFSGADADTIISGAGDDRIAIYGGADTAAAGAGSDLLIVDYADAVTAVSGGVASGDNSAGFVGHIADLDGATLDFTGVERFHVTTGAGADRILTGAGADLLSAGGGADRFNGGGGADRMLGQAGDDRLLGGDGDDRLLGGGGNDDLVGGLGRDVITGGIGQDNLLFDDGETGATRATADVVTDFSQGDGDRINLRFVDADTRSASVDDAFSFIGTGAFTGVAGQLRYETVAGTSWVMGDTDGDGAADLFVRVNGGVALDATDFVF